MDFKSIMNQNGIGSSENIIALSRDDLLRSEPPPADRYDVGITSAKVVMSRSGMRTLRVEVEILDGPYAGRTVAAYFPVDDSSGMLHRLTELFAALRLLDSEWGGTFDVNKLVGLVASVDISYESSEGGRAFPRLDGWVKVQPANESA